MVDVRPHCDHQSQVEYELIRYRREFRDEVVKLLSLVTSGDASLNDAYFCWKYEENPYIDGPLLYLAVRRGAVAGMTAAYGARWELGDERRSFTIPCFADSAVYRPHRGHRLFSEVMKLGLRDLCERSYPFAFRLSAGPATTRAARGMGWVGIGSLEPMARRKGVSRLRGYLRRNAWLAAVYHGARAQAARFSEVSVEGGADALAAERPAAAFSRLDENSARPCRGSPARVTARPRPREMAELVGRLQSDGRLRHARDEQYFAWRFRDPRFRYRFLFSEKGGSLRGYLILGALRRASRDARILDWEGTDQAVKSDLLAAALDWGRFRKVAIWAGGLDEETRGVLRQARFEPEGGVNWPPTIFLRPACASRGHDSWSLEGRDLRDGANWDLRMMYSDAF